MGLLWCCKKTKKKKWNKRRSEDWIEEEEEVCQKRSVRCVIFISIGLSASNYGDNNNNMLTQMRLIMMQKKSWYSRNVLLVDAVRANKNS